MDGCACTCSQSLCLLAQATPYIAGGRIINFDEPCDYFTVGKAKASTLSLSVLVAIEMFNALNALSEVCNHTALPIVWAPICKSMEPPVILQCTDCSLFHKDSPAII